MISGGRSFDRDFRNGGLFRAQISESVTCRMFSKNSQFFLRLNRYSQHHHTAEIPQIYIDSLVKGKDTHCLKWFRDNRICLRCQMLTENHIFFEATLDNEIIKQSFHKLRGSECLFMSVFFSAADFDP